MSLLEHEVKAWIENGRLQVRINLKEKGWVTTEDGNRLFLDGQGTLRISPDGPSVYGDEGGGGGSQSVQVSNVSKVSELNGIEKWKGDAGKIASNIKAGVGVLSTMKLTNSAGDVIGAVSYDITESDITGEEVLRVENMASNSKGAGTTMMIEMCRKAEKAGVGVELESLPNAEGFYQKLGMTEWIHPAGPVGYRFTSKQVAQFLRKIEDTVKSSGESVIDELVRSEPKDGAFTLGRKA
jgi:hypothetical protein